MINYPHAVKCVDRRREIEIRLLPEERALWLSTDTPPLPPHQKPPRIKMTALVKHILIKNILDLKP